VLVTGRFLVDRAARGFSHRIETLVEPQRIELPDPVLTVDT
jgi:hypothetical protein